MTPKWNVYLGNEVVGRPSGYPTFEAAQAAADQIAEKHGSMPYEVRPINYNPNREGAE